MVAKEQENRIILHNIPIYTTLNPEPRHTKSTIAMPGEVQCSYDCKYNSTDMYNICEAHYEALPGIFPSVEIAENCFSALG